MNKRKLAINGGTKTAENLTPPEHRTGMEEFMEITKLWEVSQEGYEKIKEVMLKECSENEPWLFRYYGPSKSRVNQLEERFGEKFGKKYALAVNSCTSSLIASLVALGIGPGDEVIVPAYTFFASVSAVVMAKAIPVIAEIDESLTLDPEDVERKITSSTKAIIIVHMRGASADMESLMEIAAKHHLKVIEDVAQSCGGFYKGKRLGTFGDCGCFSFDYYKIIHSGEGGMIITDDERTYIRAQSYHDTAACWRPNRYARERTTGELFAGENYRMSELQGAVALVQLRKLDNLLKRMRGNKNRIKSKIKNFPGLCFRKLPDAEGDTAICLIFFMPEAEIAKQVIPALQAEGVPAGGIYDKTVRDWHIYTYWEHILKKKTATDEGCPYTCPYYKGKLPDYNVDMCPKTLDILARTVHISIESSWNEQDCDEISNAVNKVLEFYLPS